MKISTPLTRYGDFVYLADKSTTGNATVGVFFDMLDFLDGQAVSPYESSIPATFETCNSQRGA